MDIIILKAVTLIAILIGSTIASSLLWIFVDITIGAIAIINIYALFSLRSIVYEEYKKM